MSRRGENIYKRKDGRWEARYVSKIMPDGTKKMASVYAKTYSEVKEKRMQKSLLVLPELSAAPTFEQAYRAWICEIRSDSRPNTVIKYEGVFRNHLCSLGNVKVKNISREIVSRLTDSLIEKGLSNKTVNDILGVFNLILKHSAEQYGINAPPVTYLRESKNRTRYLTLYEQKILCRYLCTDMDVYKFGTLLAMYTGIRVGELCALRWEDIDDYSISINKTMMRIKTDAGKTEVVIAPPKSESSVREIPIPIEILKYFAAFRSDGFVLSTERSAFCEPRHMQRKFEKYAADCNLKNVTFHTLRHTFATRCIEAGVDAKTVSELLGHADTSITLNRYVHPSFELKQASMQRMQSLLA